jgi:hypothetical protein
MYCANATKATVNYKVNGITKEFITQGLLLPIDVEVVSTSTGGVEQNFSKSFNGNILTTYSFSIDAPTEIPRIEIPQIFLLSGTWDDAGSIGTFSSTEIVGQIYTYSGQPLLVGAGYTINGTVKNLLTPACNVSLRLKWQIPQDELRIYDKNGELIFKDKGSNITFKVKCNDECLPGEIRCTTNKYPGYCCIPCPSTASKINNLAAKVRAK